MRSLKKGVMPEVLAKNAAKWLKEYLADPHSSTKKYRYRDSAIKDALRHETAWKCVYCESRIGHNTPGDVEHKIPSSRMPALHFTWNNLTIACSECNRRKNDYYDEAEQFVDPYTDAVEVELIHVGPLVFWRPGYPRMERSIRVLALDNMSRSRLMQQKVDLLEKARSLADLACSSHDPTLRQLRLDELRRMQHWSSEYSACVRTYVRAALATRFSDDKISKPDTPTPLGSVSTKDVTPP